jgi:probable DNA metabolism protein
MQYVFDETYAGFLTCVFESFARKEDQVTLAPYNTRIPDIFREEKTIVTDQEKASRVITGLQKKGGRQLAREIYQVFLSEDVRAWNATFTIIRQVFKTDADILKNFGNPDVLYFSQTLKKVSRERHRMKAFIRFSKADNGLYYALIEPDFNVIPLIGDFFRQRFADQLWLIYDQKRQYGIYYNLHTIEEVRLAETTPQDTELPAAIIAPDTNDQLYAHLWQSYFKSTNIEARKNMKLHLRHVPKRYWKHLVEKQGQ